MQSGDEMRTPGAAYATHRTLPDVAAAHCLLSALPVPGHDTDFASRGNGGLSRAI